MEPAESSQVRSGMGASSGCMPLDIHGVPGGGLGGPIRRRGARRGDPGRRPRRLWASSTRGRPRRPVHWPIEPPHLADHHKEDV